MAWKGVCPVGERLQLVEMVRKQEISVAEAARIFGVSRKTAHKWLNRAEASGVESGLLDRSRARHTQTRFEGRALEALIDLRQAHPTWGPRTLIAALSTKQPRLAMPAASTLGDILKREGLVRSRRRSPRTGASPYQVGDTTPAKPNDRWTIDYKGHFKLRDGTPCHPLTIRDAFSRAVLCIDAFDAIRGTDVIRALEGLFQVNGLPDEMHSDTGAPFGGNGLARLSAVSVYLLKLGIRPVYSRPGNPQDNGAHERMHRDLKAETTRPPGQNLEEQQSRFDAFRGLYNEVRPHQALGGATPASVYSKSQRKRPSALDSPSYPGHFELRKVETGGLVTWKRHRLLISGALRRETIGLEPIDDGLWRIHFAQLAIGLLDERAGEPKVLGLNRAEPKAA